MTPLMERTGFEFLAWSPTSPFEESDAADFGASEAFATERPGEWVCAGLKLDEYPARFPVIRGRLGRGMGLRVQLLRVWGLRSRFDGFGVNG